MAGALEEQRLRQVYAALQAASCPLVDGLHLQEADSMLELLCVPSEHRTNLLAWICSSINPNFGSSKATSMRSKDPEVLVKEMAAFGQELMLCRAGDLDLIRGDASVHRQLQFLEQLLTLVPGSKTPAGPKTDTELLLNDFYAAENLPILSHMLTPTLDPWPARIKSLQKGTKSSSKPTREKAADVDALLQQTQSAQSALEQLQSQCEFLNSESQSPVVFASALRVSARDLQQLMATFSHVYETDLRAHCSRDPPTFSTETEVFERVHHLLLAFITELELLKEASEASVSVSEKVNQIQTQPRYHSRGEKHTLQNQLEELTRRIREVFPCSTAKH
ncbi:HAUS augmin-like complex subunit 7 [Symphorus nematophorus]